MPGNFLKRYLSRRVWIRQYGSKFSSWLNHKINDLLVRVAWTVSPIETLIVFKPDLATLVPFALSQANLNQDTLTTFRVIDRSEKSPSLTVWNLNNDKFARAGSIPFAEDARVFQARGALFIYYQVAVQREDGSLDCDIFIFDPVKSITTQVFSPFLFNGKNWVPYEYEGCLHFIYSIDPIIVLRTKSWTDEILLLEVAFTEKAFSFTEFAWGDRLGIFGSIRGGSQLLPIGNDKFLGFTHVTPPGVLKFSHQAGILLYDAKTFTVEHKNLTELKPGLLLDPFDICLSGDIVQMSYSFSVNNPHELESVVGSSVAVFSFERLYKLF